MINEMNKLSYKHDNVLIKDLAKSEVYLAFLNRLEKVIYALMEFNPKRVLGKFYVKNTIGLSFINIRCEREQLGDVNE